MNMVTEGFYATKCIKMMNKKFRVDIPIVDIAYEILYNKVSPRIIIKKLIDVLH